MSTTAPPTTTTSRARPRFSKRVRVVRVAPVGGRLMLFDARSILHAAEPRCHNLEDRPALTVWFGGAFCYSVVQAIRKR